MSSKNAAVVIGVGPEVGLGASLAKCFAQNGLHVFIAGRSDNKLQKVANSIRCCGGSTTSVVADATAENEVINLFEIIDSEGYALDIAAYNVDSNIQNPLLETDTETFTDLWRQNCLGGFFFAKAALKMMLAREKGSIFFTGASASLRARPPFTGFASAKAGLRALAQGMAREFSCQGIHVVHAVIDGVIDGERARTQFPQLVEAKGEDGLLHLDAITQTYWAIHCQHPSAWTHELDLRPFKEVF